MLRAVSEPAAAGTDAIADAVVDAALRQFELFGITRSTVEDISRRARVSRVTVYRRFPGKDRLIEAVMQRELRRFLADLETAVAELDDPQDKLVEGFVFTLESVRGHRLLQRMLESEPEAILPHLTTHGAPFIAAGRDFLAAQMASELDDGRTHDEQLVAADLTARLIVSFLLTPQTPIDLDDPAAARAFARRYLSPLLTPRGEA
jgi:AcrR family transcriptional regulator